MEKIPVRHINGTQKQPDLSGSFSIRDIQTLLAGTDLVQDLHRHDFFFMLALAKGRGSHSIDFKSYPADDHTVFLLRPGQVHQLVLKEGSTGYLVQFAAGIYDPGYQLLHKAFGTNQYQFDTLRFEKILALLNNIFQEQTDKKENYQQVIKANMDILFIELGRQGCNSTTGNLNHYTQDRLDAFLSLLETHIFTCKQPAQYAAMLNLSAYQLNATVKVALAKTCSQLINEQIILEAKRCLLATTNQVSQTAYQLGYQDVSYFIRFFKKHTGYSPEAFRHNFK